MNIISLLISNLKIMIIKNWKKYYTMAEAKEISDKKIEKMWDIFISKLKDKQKISIKKTQNIKNIFKVSLNSEFYV